MRTDLQGKNSSQKSNVKRNQKRKKKNIAARWPVLITALTLVLTVCVFGIVIFLRGQREAASKNPAGSLGGAGSVQGSPIRDSEGRNTQETSENNFGSGNSTQASGKGSEAGNMQEITENHSSTGNSWETQEGQDQNPGSGQTLPGQSEVQGSEEFLDEIAQKAKNILSKMTVEEKVGQMFIARCPETNAVQKVTEFHLGGYILFGRDFSGKEKAEVVQTIQSYQEVSEIPLLIGVDEEGGTVNRVSSNRNLRAEPFRSPQELYAEGGFDLIRSDTQEKCDLLLSLGIHLNFAPVCDVAQSQDDFIWKRSFGQDAEQTAEYVKTVVEVMQDKQVGSVLKHFPGYGNNVDTHTGVAYDNRPYETFQDSDFLPFQAGIDAGASMVLVSHNVVSCMDDRSPASLSPKVHEILREQLGFDGVVITDDLAMDGVREFAGEEETAILAVQAGNDMLCCTDFEVQIPAVLEAVRNGDIAEERVDESVLRILKLKILLGILP